MATDKVQTQPLQKYYKAQRVIEKLEGKPPRGGLEIKVEDETGFRYGITMSYGEAVRMFWELKKLLEV